MTYYSILLNFLQTYIARPQAHQLRAATQVKTCLNEMDNNKCS